MANNQHNHNQPAIAKVRFMGQFEPITGIGYRFTPQGAESIEGTTDEDGFTKTLIGDSTTTDIDNAPETEQVYFVNMKSHTLPITLEVQRDDGSWKEIGNFKLEADKEKNITAQIETIALPFKLELVKGL